MILQERQNHKNVFFLKTSLFLNLVKSVNIKSVNIKYFTSNYVVPKYRVQFGVNFDNFGLAVFVQNKLMFCAKQANVSEIFASIFQFT